LTFASDIDTKSFSLVTSPWKNDSRDADIVIEVVNAYWNFTANLDAHVPAGAGYLSAQSLLDKVYEGHAVYGSAALDVPFSGATTALIAAIDAGLLDDPLWVTM
jgi:hypothetical protein